MGPGYNLRTNVQSWDLGTRYSLGTKEHQGYNDKMSVAKAADEFSVCNVQANDSELFCLDFRSFFVPVEITAVPVVVAF